MTSTNNFIHVPDKASGVTGAYYASALQLQGGVLLKYSSQILLQNLVGSEPNFLGTCSYENVCDENQAVYTYTNGPGDYRPEKWRILTSEGTNSTSNVNYGD